MITLYRYRDMIAIKFPEGGTQYVNEDVVLEFMFAVMRLTEDIVRMSYTQSAIGIITVGENNGNTESKS